MECGLQIIKIADKKALPPEGVYIATATLENKTYYGITHIGPQPTISNDKKISVETHLLNFNKDIYGLEMEIQLMKRLRTPQKFDNLTLLLEQIRLDCIAVQEFYGIRRISSRLYMNAQKHEVKIDNHALYLSPKNLMFYICSIPALTLSSQRNRFMNRSGTKQQTTTSMLWKTQFFK